MRLSDGVTTQRVRGPMGRIYSNAVRSPISGTMEDGDDAMGRDVVSTYLTWSRRAPNFGGLRRAEPSLRLL